MDSGGLSIILESGMLRAPLPVKVRAQEVKVGLPLHCEPAHLEIMRPPEYCRYIPSWQQQFV